jgi:hypothetical protein
MGYRRGFNRVMSRQRVISGAHIKLYVNGVVYNEVQQIDYLLDYGEEPIYGIDSIFPQEIKVSRVSIQGNVSGIRVISSNGLQGYNLRPKITDSYFAPYVSLRIVDRRTGEDIMFIPHARVTSEKMSVSAKGNVSVNFSFTGLQGQQTLDRPVTSG